MASFDIGHAGRVEFNDLAAVGHKSDGSGDRLLIDERLHPLPDLRENLLIHACRFGVGLSEDGGSKGNQQQGEEECSHAEQLRAFFRSERKTLS